MEIQKPFKCPVCTSRFTNEDHLQVHKRRHEMSLNLSKSAGGLTAGVLDSFVEETPSPTRFFRNCEEVGLFQDLQNVNPFDEQFSKATSATPSTENFEFHFSVTTSATASTAAKPISTLSMRRSADQETLNTPQVIGYPTISSTTNTTSIITTSSTSLPLSLSTPQVQVTSPKMCDMEKSSNLLPFSENGSNSSREPLNPSKVLQNPGISTTTPTESSTGNIEDISLAVQLNFSPLKSNDQINGGKSLKSRNKTKNLRLTLTPQCDGSDAEKSASIISTSSSTSASTSITSASTSITSAKPLDTPIIPEIAEIQASKDGRRRYDSEQMLDKKSELLERNRAAASRSRERRKQWVSGLESRNNTLLTALTKVRLENQRILAENRMLKEQLSRHGNCDVTKAEKSQQSHILQQNTNIIMNPPTSPSIPPQTRPLPLIATSQQVTIVQRPNIPMTKPKRGRPRKGQEKRLEIVCVPSSASSNCEIPVKVQILPLSHSKPSQILILQNPN